MNLIRPVSRSKHAEEFIDLKVSFVRYSIQGAAFNKALESQLGIRKDKTYKIINTCSKVVVLYNVVIQ